MCISWYANQMTLGNARCNDKDSELYINVDEFIGINVWHIQSQVLILF